MAEPAQPGPGRRRSPRRAPSGALAVLRWIGRSAVLRILLVPLVGAAVALVAHDAIDREADAALAAAFERRSEVALTDVTAVMDDYQTRLGMIAAFAASRDDMPPEAWARFVRGTGILATSSDAGIGYIEIVPAGGLPDHIGREMAFGRPRPIPVAVPERMLGGSDLYVLTRAVSDAPGFPDLPSSDLGSIPTVGTAIDAAVESGELQTFAFGDAISEAVGLAAAMEAQGFDIDGLRESLEDLLAVMSASPGGILVPVLPAGGPPTGLVLAGSLPSAEIGALQTRVGDDLVLRLGVVAADGRRVIQHGDAAPPAGRYATTVRGSLGGIEWFADITSTPAFDGSVDRSAADVGAAGILAVALLAATTLLVRRRLLIRSAATLAKVAATERSARTDRLTGLLNRAGLDAALAAMPGEHWPAAVVFVDLDGLKRVNDTGGHEAGDALLRAAARRLRRATRSTDRVARLGGDEFVVVGAGIASIEGARAFGAKLLAALADSARDPADPGTEVRASVGVAVAVGADDAADAVRRADAAMYVAKERGGCAVVAEPVGA